MDTSLGVRTHGGSQWPTQYGCTLAAVTPTDPPNFLPKVNVQLRKTSAEFSFEELDKCSFEAGAWRNTFRRGLGSPPATPASEIHGSELIFVNKTKSETKANFRQEPGNPPNY